MREFIVTLLCLSAGGSLLALALMLLRRLCGRRLTGRFYYYVWLVVLLRFVLPIPGLVSVRALSPQSAVLPDSGYAESVPARNEIPMPNGINPALTTESVTGRPRPVNNYVFPGAAGNRIDAVISAEQAIERTNAPAASAGESAAARMSVWGGFWQGAKKLVSSWKLWFFVWAAGAAISFAGCVATYCRFARHLRRTGLIPRDIDLEVYFSMPGGRKPGLVRSSFVTTPMLLGLFNPTIVLPDRHYTPEMLNNVFAHELEHYRRGDIAYKWFAAFVSALHWFNPLVYIIQNEIDSACEFSCDEQVLRYMSADEKRSYGETILNLAAAGTLSPSVMATSFATQKRDLKERLYQIINFQARSATAVAVSLAAALLLIGCGAALGPNAAQDSEAPAEPAPLAIAPAAPDAALNVQQGDESNVIHVSTVDEFLSAIGSDRTIILSPGTYELSAASDYGQKRDDSAPYYWGKVYGGSQLIIDGVSGLRIEASNDANITTASNYATPLTVQNSADVSLEGLKIGRAGLEYAYNSDALGFNSCERVSVTGCELYSSGNSGIRCETCADVSAVNCKIYDCGNAAVWCRDSENVYLEDCEIYDCAWGEYGVIFSIHNARGFVVTSCDIHDNESTALITSNGSSLAYILGCEVAQGNTFSKELFDGYGGKIYVGGCLFNGTSTWPRLIGDSENVVPLGLDGDKLTYADIAKMELTQIDPPENAARAVFTPPELEKTVNAEGYTVVNVSTVDELLAAIDSKTIINLAPGTYDFSTAGNCGGYGSRRYRWEGMDDAPMLIIMGVKDLHFVADPTADEPTEFVSGNPSFIMNFRTCSGVSFDGISMHTKEGNEYPQTLLEFSNVDNISLSRCKLYDCNFGIYASECSGINIAETEISGCESSGVWFTRCDNISFSGCNIHDCAEAEGNFLNCENVIYNNTALKNGTHNFSSIA